VRYANGDRVELARNDAYWGETVLAKVTFRIIKNSRRVATLLSGDVDDGAAAPADLAASRVIALPVTSKISHRVIYFNFDHLDRQSPFITGKDGKPPRRTPARSARAP
jgi:peptide/nickel transport system substrate-binding protein